MENPNSKIKEAESFGGTNMRKSKRMLAIVMAVVMAFAYMPAITFAASNSQIGVSPNIIWQDGFGFHCNKAGGNGATAVEYKGDVKAIKDAISKIKKQPAGSMAVEKGDQKDIFGTKTYQISLERVGATTTWNLKTGTDIVCMTCGRTDWVTYSNNSGVINGKNIQANHPELDTILFIKKSWVDLEGKPVDPPEGVEAIFDIYKGGQPVSGAPFIAGAVSGRNYPVEPGIYTVVERLKAGYVEQDPVTLTVGYGESKSFAFTNAPEPPADPDGALRFEKRVEGKNIVEWLMAKYDAIEVLGILAGLEFYLEGPENYGPVTPDSDGMVVFEDIMVGTYTLSEEVTGDAVGIFAAMEPITGIVVDEDGATVTVNGLYYSFGNGGEGGGNFDYNATFLMDNIRAYLNGALLADFGDFHVTNSETGESLYSFCGDFNSGTFDGAVLFNKSDVRFAGADGAKFKADVLKVFNYIYDTWGSLDQWPKDLVNRGADNLWHEIYKYSSSVEFGDVRTDDQKAALATKAIAQLALWNLLGEEFILDEVNGSDRVIAQPINDAVKQVMDNYAAYDGKKITDIVFLAQEDYTAGDFTQSQPQIVPVFGGGCWVENDRPAGKDGSLSFEKRVEDKNIVTWLIERFGFDITDADDLADLMAILSGLEFYLDGDNGNYGPESPDFDGMVVFPFVNDGTYTLSEEITGAAAGLFTKMEDIEITIEGDVYFALGGKVTGSITGDFDLDGFYTIHHNWNGSANRRLGFAGLTYGGEVFNIWIKDAVTGDEYSAFCANGGSKTFPGDNSQAGYGNPCTGMMVDGGFNGVDPAKFINAYNYIEKNAGYVFDNRAAAQVITWLMTGCITIEDLDNLPNPGNNGFQNELSADEIALIKAAYLARYTQQNGPITSLAFMVCENHYDGHSFEFCQPQIVPLYGTFCVENELMAGKDGTAQAIFNISGTRKVIEYGYTPNTKTRNETLVSKDGIADHPNGRNFRGVVVDIALGGVFEIADSSPSNRGIGLFYEVEVAGNEITITFDENYVSSRITAKAYKDVESAKDPKNGNFDNSKHWNDNTGVIKLALPAGAADTFFLFIHIESLTYYDGTYTKSIIDEYNEDVVYDGALSLVVVNEAGEVVYDSEAAGDVVEFDLDGMYAIPGVFPAGKYTATLSGDGFDPIGSEGEIVEAGDIMVFDFGSKVVTYPDEIVDPGEPNNNSRSWAPLAQTGALFLVPDPAIKDSGDPDDPDDPENGVSNDANIDPDDDADEGAGLDEDTDTDTDTEAGAGDDSVEEI